MVNRYKRLIAAVAAAASLHGCCIHQEPKPPVPDTPEPHERQFTLRLEFERDMPLLGEYVYGDGSVARARSGADEADRPHDMRYIIKAFTMGRAGETSRASDTTFIFTRPHAAGPDATFVLDMPPGDFRLLVWADYTDPGTDGADKYYLASDFEEIILSDRNAHSGSDPWREAFSGRTETASESRAADGTVSRTPLDGATVTMRRPMARYRFISTDLRRFRSRAGRAGRAPDLSQYTVRMTYTRYMPCSYNMFTDRPADSWTGVSYASSIRPLDDDEAEIAFDYVFVNGTQTAVTVAAEVFDTDGTLLARIPAFDVPLKRAMETVVKGGFLTARASGSTAISPEFDGSFDVFIQ